MAGLSGLAKELGPVLRTLGDLQAVGNMFGGAMGGGAGHGSPFGLGKSPGSPGIGGLVQKIAMNMAIGMPAGLAADTGRLGLTFAGKRNEQMVGQDVLNTGERILGKGLNVLANPVNPKNLAEFGAELVAVIPTIERWGKALLSNVDDMAKFDAGIAKASAVMQLGEFQRTSVSAQITGESTLELAEGLEGLMNDLQPVKDAITIMLNDGMLVLVDIAKDLYKTVSDAFEWFVKFLEAQVEWMKNSWVPGVASAGSAIESMTDYVRKIQEEVSRSNVKPADQISMGFLEQIRQREAIARPMQFSSGVAGSFG